MDKIPQNTHKIDKVAGRKIKYQCTKSNIFLYNKNEQKNKNPFHFSKKMKQLDISISNLQGIYMLKTYNATGNQTSA